MSVIPPSPAEPGGVSPVAPPQELVRSSLSDGEWHRMHPLTPLLRGGLVLIFVIGVVIANLRDRLIAIFLPGLAPGMGDQIADYEEWESTGDPIDFVIANNLYLVAVLVVLVVLLLVVAYFYTSWRFHTFRITGDDVEVRTGILFRTHRRAPLDRVQGVNLTRPMLARLVGLAKLEVVGAGADGNVKLEYLTTANAETIRADILRLASGVRLAEAAAAAPAGASGGSRVAALGMSVSRELNDLVEGVDHDAEPESVVHIPTGRVVASHLISGATIALIVAIIAVIIGVSLGATWLLFGIIPSVIGFGTYWVRQLTRSMRYSIAQASGGVRITFGLLTTVTETVPPGRVHAISVTQPLLWRRFGWWKISINRFTGRSEMDGSAQQFSTALPVGTVADVEKVLALLQPRIPAETWHTVVQDGMLGARADDPFTNTPRRGRWLALLSWRRNGFLRDDDVLLLRAGVVWRSLSILPLARLQSVAVHQGPLQRMLRVARIRGHVVAGPAGTTLSAIDRDHALTLFEDVAARAVRASTGDHSHRWAQESGVELGLRDEPLVVSPDAHVTAEGER